MLAVLEFTPSPNGVLRYLVSSTTVNQDNCRDLLQYLLQLHINDIVIPEKRKLSLPPFTDIDTSSFTMPSNNHDSIKIIIVLSRVDAESPITVHCTNIDTIFPQNNDQATKQILSLFEFCDQIYMLNDNLTSPEDGIHMISSMTYTSSGASNEASTTTTTTSSKSLLSSNEWSLTSSIVYHDLILTREEEDLKTLRKTFSSLFHMHRTVDTTHVHDMETTIVKHSFHVIGLDNCVQFVQPDGVFHKIRTYFKFNLYIQGYPVPSSIKLSGQPSLFKSTSTSEEDHKLYSNVLTLRVSNTVTIQLLPLHDVRLLVSNVVMMDFNGQYLFQQYRPNVYRAVIVQSEELKQEKLKFKPYIERLTRAPLRKLYEHLNGKEFIANNSVKLLREYFYNLVSNPSPEQTFDLNTWKRLCQMADELRQEQELAQTSTIFTSRKNSSSLKRKRQEQIPSVADVK